MTPNQFKELRLTLGYSQKEMAHRLYYARIATISDKETGKAPITQRDKRMIKELLKK